MDVNGPIVIIEDDKDDAEWIEVCMKLLPYRNQRIYFTDAISATKFLDSDHPELFLILSDIGMPKVNGLGLLQYINKHPRLQNRCVPFVYLAISSHKETILQAQHQCAHGYFVKGESMDALRTQLDIILKYWKTCSLPSTKEFNTFLKAKQQHQFSTQPKDGAL